MKIKHLLYLLPLLLCCCNPDNPQITPDPNFEFEYEANYDSVIVMRANSTYYFIFNIDVINGNISNNMLTCTISNLPGNVTVNPSSIVVGQIKGGSFTFKTGDIAAGTDTMKFTINSPSTGTVVRKLILKILPPIDYAPKLAGNYDSSYNFCAPVITEHKSVVTADAPYSVKISNLNNLGSTFIVSAKVSEVIIIPYQVVGAHKIWGRGTYTPDPKTGNTELQAEIADTIVTGTDTLTCTAHLQRK